MKVDLYVLPSPHAANWERPAIFSWHATHSNFEGRYCWVSTISSPSKLFNGAAIAVPVTIASLSHDGHETLCPSCRVAHVDACWDSLARSGAGLASQIVLCAATDFKTVFADSSREAAIMVTAKLASSLPSSRSSFSPSDSTRTVQVW